MEITSEALTAYFRVILPLLDERQRRLVAAATVPMLGRGGQARVAEATGFSRNTLIGGAKEIEGGAGPSDRVRRPGGGRKKATDINPTCWPPSTPSSVPSPGAIPCRRCAGR